MISRGIATFTLDYGKCPPWLFKRMVKLGRHILYIIAQELGPEEFIARIADPVWFQSLGTVLAFDWNASGLTTILTAALKEAIRDSEDYFGIYIAGGKGKTSRKTPDDIVRLSEIAQIPEKDSNSLVYNSKIAAKVDSSLVQDGYQLYHHAFFFSKTGAWAVVQQGMNTTSQTARRYHWSSQKVTDRIVEPHSGIAAQLLHPGLNLTDKNSDQTRFLSVDLLNQSYVSLMKDITILRRHSSSLSKMVAVQKGAQQLTLLELFDEDFTTHPVVNDDFSKSKYLEKILFNLTEKKPANYEAFIATSGVGPKTVRALSLVSEVIYGAKPSYEDPARYSFAHGGKDAIPYPVDLHIYDATIDFFRRIVSKSTISLTDKQQIHARLDKPSKLTSPNI